MWKWEPPSLSQVEHAGGSPYGQLARWEEGKDQRVEKCVMKVSSLD